MKRADHGNARADDAAWARRWLGAADHLDDWLGRLCKLVIVVSGIALTVIMTANVIARYALASGGFRWAQELPMMLFPLFVIAGMALAAQAGAHMAVEWLYDRFADAGKARVFILSQLISAASMAVLAYHSVVVGNIAAIEHSPILGVPKSLGYYALSAGSLLIALVTLIAVFRVALNGWAARPKPENEDLPL